MTVAVPVAVVPVASFAFDTHFAVCANVPVEMETPGNRTPFVTYPIYTIDRALGICMEAK